MSVFQDNAITEAGCELLSHVQVGAVFTPTKIVLGSGYMPSGKTAKTMTNVVAVVKNLDIVKKERSNDGKATFGGVYSNEDITESWYFRELALYAKAVYPNGTEVAECLYSYGNAGAGAELMPAYSTGHPVERQMDIVTWVGNDAAINLTIDPKMPVLREQMGVANGVATLGADGIIPRDQIPAATDLGAAPIISALSASYDMDAILKSGRHCSIYLTGANTLGTPYKYGVTDHTGAAIISYASSIEYGHQIAIMSGNVLLGRTLNNGVISPWTTEFLPMNGGTLKGSLSVSRGAEWAQFIALSKSGFYRAFEADDSRIRIDCRNDNSVDNRRHLDFFNRVGAQNIEDALRIADVVDGVQKTYTIVHTGNIERYAAAPGLVPASVE